MYIHVYLQLFMKLLYNIVPPPMVKIISSMADPVLTGSSLNLTCIVEWMKVVPRPVDIQVVWSGPNGSLLESDLVMETPLRYISDIELDAINSTYKGEYTCTTNVGKEMSISAKKTLTVGKHMLLQINFQKCI